ncbi:MAG TPA: patatin-like phospholipase family protein [Bryobacteraceae bacterium]|nr:patatin-like phospholipase family protein [Bryobacteraceae bacterium]
MQRTLSASETVARQIFAGGGTRNPEELLNLARKVRDEDNNLEYSYRLLLLASQNVEGASQEVRYRIQRDLALCTYKNPDLPPDRRLKEAESIDSKLLEDATLTRAQRQDALGLMGAIWKQRWRTYGLREHLEKSLLYYREGMALGIELDYGYTAVNAAFVLDLLASIGADTAGEVTLQQEARHIRETVRDALLHIAESQPDLRSQFWFLATLGEVYLGLGDFQEAERWMAEARAQPHAPWQLETTARQVAKLASLIHPKRAMVAGEQDSPGQVIKALTGDEHSTTSFLLGKVGLALSGGGFRASLFHIGMLARLAELDVLRHVEVLSCVSGGSIVGAFYYLELRKRLQEKEKLDQADYIQIIENVEHKFLKGVQRNIRLRMLMGFRTNLRVLTSRNSSMTERLATLYDRELYDLVEDEFKGKRRSLSDILITPKGTQGRFRPKYDNWGRSDKVPILILNSTTLNTCHNWQFTGSFMGEPPARGIQADIDANDRFRRMYHEDAPLAYREPGSTKSRVRLSEAVAASACVPALFDPLVFDGLYGTTYDPNRPTHYVTRLVDGGAYDNQGVTSLLEQDCTVLLVSDASGQTGLSEDPGGGRIDVMQRSNNILMSRVREAQYQYLAALRDSGVIHGLMYIHLKKGLESTPVDWIDSPDRAVRRSPGDVMTNYNVRRDVQTLLARVRTDLDSFSNCEADALMLSGYLMTRTDFDVCLPEFPVQRGVAHAWRFRDIASIVSNPATTRQTEELREALSIAAHIWLKPLKASPVMKAITTGWIVVLAGLLVYFCLSLARLPVAQTPLGSIWIGEGIGIIAGTIVLLLLLRIFLNKVLRYRNSYGQMLVSLFMCSVGWILLRAHLYVAEGFYLRFGPNYRSRDKPPGAVGVGQLSERYDGVDAIR